MILVVGAGRLAFGGVEKQAKFIWAQCGYRGII
jgi:hypothetical protein